MKYIGIRKYAEIHGLSIEGTRLRLKRGRIPGAHKDGREWKIPIESNSFSDEGSAGFDPDLAQIVSPMDRAKYRREKALADLKEIDLAKARRELVPIGEIKAEWSKIARRVREGMLSVPSKISAELACETDPFRCEMMIEAEIHQALMELTDRAFHDEEDDGD